MTAICGKSFLISDSNSNDFVMAKTTSMTVNNSAVDISTKATQGWMELLGDCGVRQLTLSMDGVYTNETFEVDLFQAMLDATVSEYTLTDGFGNTIVSQFLVSDYSQSGDYNDSQQFSCTLQSSGVPVFTPAP